MPVSWGLRPCTDSLGLCVSLNCASEVALTGPEGPLCPLLDYGTGEFLCHTQERGRREMETMIRLVLLWKCVCVLSTPPKAVRSSAVIRLLPGGSAGVIYPTSAPSLILAAAIQRNGSSGGKHGEFWEDLTSSFPSNSFLSFHNSSQIK